MLRFERERSTLTTQTPKALQLRSGSSGAVILSFRIWPANWLQEGPGEMVGRHLSILVRHTGHGGLR